MTGVAEASRRKPDMNYYHLYYLATDGTHNYTARKEEQDYLVSLGWDDEQFGWAVK